MYKHEHLVWQMFVQSHRKNKTQRRGILLSLHIRIFIVSNLFLVERVYSSALHYKTTRALRCISTKRSDCADWRQPSWMNWRQKTSRAISWDKRRAKYGFTSNLIFCWCLRLKKIEREVILLFFLFLFTYLFIYDEHIRSADAAHPTKCHFTEMISFSHCLPGRSSQWTAAVGRYYKTILTVDNELCLGTDLTHTVLCLAYVDPIVSCNNIFDHQTFVVRFDVSSAETVKQPVKVHVSIE